jgi:hypothetical protein
LLSFPILAENKLKAAIFIYGALLVLSCVAGYLSKFKISFSGKASTQIFWGMMLFLLCDITVLLPVIYPDETFAQMARAFTGIFYTPSLLLLAWSGINKLKS